VTFKPVRDGKGVGIALSGGGHRAALFAAGALLGIVDAGEHLNTVSISSVSGGSLTNGVVARGGDFTTMTRTQLEETLRPGIRIFCHDGLFFPGPKTDRYVAWVFFLFGLFAATLGSAVVALIAMGRHWDLWPTTVVASAAGAVLSALLGGLMFGGPWRFRWPLLAGLLTSCGLATLAVLATRDLTRWRALLGVVGVILVTAVVGWFTSRQFGKRSDKVDKALRDDAFLSTVALREVDRAVHHVFCPTDLQTADHAYFTPRIVYGHNMGVSEPVDSLRLSTVVQASACLPGVFAPRKLSAREVGRDFLPAQQVVLTDGGVYDNMADQWEFGWDNRYHQARLSNWDLAQVQPMPASKLIVINAGGAFRPKALRESGLRFEVASLMRCKDVLYDVSTSLRRRYLVDIFEKASQQDDLRGALVHIAQDPWTVPRRYSSSTDANMQQRAKQALTFLDRLQHLDEHDWSDIRDRNVAVKTVLSALDEEASVNLLHHAHVLTRINLYVLLNSGNLPDAGTKDETLLDQFGRSRFRRLVEDSRGH